MTAALATDWRTHAACIGQGDLFFRAEADRTGGLAHRRQREAALRLCATCPVRRPCIADELAAPGGRKSMTRGGWWWDGRGKPHPHPADADLMRRHYPTKENS